MSKCIWQTVSCHFLGLFRSFLQGRLSSCFFCSLSALYSLPFIHMIQVAYTSIQCKIKINGLLSEPFTPTRGACQECPLSFLLYIVSYKVLAVSIDTNTRIKGIQIGDHEQKILNFVGDTIIFFRQINYLMRIQSNLKLCENVASNLKISFQKFRSNEIKHIKMELMNQGKWYDHNFPLKTWSTSCSFFP